MDDRCARLTLMLTLPPLTFFVFCGVLSTNSSKVEQVASLTGTVLSLALAMLVWRRYVRWSVLRSAPTAAVAALVTAQILLWRPLWRMGCMDDALCTAQSLAALGLAFLLLPFIWWGLPTRAAGRSTERRPMTPNAVRLTIGFALIPLLSGLFWLLAWWLDEWLSLQNNWIAVYSYLVCTLLAVLVWWLTWRRTVRWTRRVRIWTAVLGLLLVASSATPLLEPWAPSGVGNILCWLAPVFLWAVWLAGTAWLWRTPGGRILPLAATACAEDDLVRCPQCAYSLRGLREVRCPECGWTGTVDDVVELSTAALVQSP